jgi:hypothetical protein
VAAGALQRLLLALRFPLAADRQAKHVQVAMMHILAAEIPQGTAFASVMAAMGGRLRRQRQT